MSIRNVEQGIAAIQAGNVEEGARLLQIALKSPDVTGTMRGVACLWLAEVSSDLASKRQFYEDALAADPNNAQIRQRVEGWLATQMPPPPPANVPLPPSATPPPSPPVHMPEAAAAPPPPPGLPESGGLVPNPAVLSGATLPVSPFAPQQPVVSPPTPPAFQPQAGSGPYTVVGIIGGPNGPGTAFFVAREGLLATTRYVVGGMDKVTVQLDTGRQMDGYVVRAFPEIDLAFIYVELVVNDLIPVSPLPRLPDETPLTVVSYNGQIVRGRRRSTKRVLSPQWFPTDITVVPDAGGCPVLDDRHYLVGMMTRNATSTSSYVHGLNIGAIRQHVEMFRQETMSGSRLYCPHCGSYSQAPAGGGYYCEICGALTPQAERVVRFRQPQTDRFYQEHSRISCMYCNATVGFHKGACLRCGRAPS